MFKFRNSLFFVTLQKLGLPALRVYSVACLLCMGCSDKFFTTNNLVETWLNPKWQGPIHVMVSAENADSVIIFLGLDPTRFPVVHKDEEKIYRSGFLRLGIFSFTDKKMIIDTASLNLSFPINRAEKYLVCSVGMKAPFVKDYQLWVKPERQPARFYPVLRSTYQADAEWRLTHEKGEPILDPNELLDKPTLIGLRNVAKGKEVFVRRFNFLTCQPLPPFVNSFTPCPSQMSTLGVLSVNQNQTVPVILPGGGIYLLQVDTSGVGAKRVSIIDEASLQWVNHQALRYITTQEEWTRLEQEQMDVWDFWVSVGGSTQRAVQLSSAFRNSVIEACRLFGEEVLGALTDRGMIFIVFGAPTSVYTSQTVETWTYAPSGAMPLLTFDFDITHTPQGISKYKLRRNPYFREPWMKAVERYRR